MPENMAQVVLAGRVPEVPLSRAAPGDVLPLPEISGSGRVHGSGVAFRGREDCQRERKRALRTHFGACEIFDLRGKALNRAAQIAKAVGALGAVPVQAASRLVPFRLEAGQGFSVLSL